MTVLSNEELEKEIRAAIGWANPQHRIRDVKKLIADKVAEAEKKARIEAIASYKKVNEFHEKEARIGSTQWGLSRLIDIKKGIRTFQEVEEMFYESIVQLQTKLNKKKHKHESGGVMLTSNPPQFICKSCGERYS